MGSKQGKDLEGHKIEESAMSDQKRPKLVENESSDIIIKSSAGSGKKRKSRSVFGLAKCTSNDGDGPTTDLVDCRINVWWPMDKKFYEGVVKSYDPEKKKHVVLYNDGDVEVLRLDKERWELIEGNHRPKKKTNITKSPAKMMSPKKKIKKSRSKTSDKRPSSVKGKRSKKKTSITDQTDGLEGKTASASEDVENRSDISNAEPTISSASDRQSGDDADEKLDDVLTSQACDVEEKSKNAEMEVDREEVAQDTDDSGELAKLCPTTEHKTAGESSQQDSRTSDVALSHEEDEDIENISGSSQKESGEGNQIEEAKSDPSPNKTDTSDAESDPSPNKTETSPNKTETSDTEDADDVPLSTWKRRITKSQQ